MKTLRIIADNKIPFIEGRIKNAEIIYASPEDIDKDLVKDADGLLIRTRTRCNEKLLAGSKVKLVATGTIGMDHIDTDWCETNGIAVRNSAGCNAPGVAQYVWSSLLRTGFDPSKHTLGIIGYGNIGSIVADWGRRMGAKVLVNDPPRQFKGINDIEYVDLPTLLKNSDAVTLHVPLTRTGEFKTLKLIGEKEFEALKTGATLINASRGGTVEENTWIEAIEKKGIKAIVDVWEGEPAINTLLLEKALITTPHIAGYSKEGKSRAARMVLEAVKDILDLEVDLEGLEPAYKQPEGNIDSRIIVDSYDPFDYAEVLRRNPQDFENIRESYIYRNEPVFK